LDVECEAKSCAFDGIDLVICHVAYDFSECFCDLGEGTEAIEPELAFPRLRKGLFSFCGHFRAVWVRYGGQRAQICVA